MPRKKADLCHTVRNKVEKWREHFSDNIKEYHYWFNFVMGDQWDEKEQSLIKEYKKTPLVMNKLSPLCKHVLGEQRQNTPNLQAIPDENTPQQVMEVRDSLIKSIMFNSDAKVVYQSAFQQALVGGFGAYYIETDYVNKKAFEQEPKIRALTDATKAYWDISAVTPNKTDGMFAGFVTRVSREAFKQQYGDKINSKIGANFGEIDTNFVWSNEDEVCIIRHYQRKMKKDTLYELDNGERIYQDEYDKSLQKLEIPDQEDMPEDEVLIRDDQLVEVVNQRDVMRDTIKVYKIAGDYILEETDYPSEELGVIFVDQNSWYDKKGKQICVPYFKDAQDAQRYLNYLATQSAYIWKVARYDQFMASKANVRSQETQAIWKDPASYQGALIYDIDPDGNTKPERLAPPELPQAFLTQYQRALDDIHSSTGIYGTQLGQQGAELSGAAVDARTRQGNYISYVVYDSLNRAIATGGRIINQMIPVLYDTEREVTMELPDKGMSRVKLNESDEFGNVINNNVKDGEYKVKLVPGPSYEGQQQQSIDSMNVVLQADKSGQVFPMIADLYVDNLDLNNKVEFKNRLRTIVPPQVIQAGKTGQMPPPQPKQPDPAMIMAQTKMKEAGLKEKQLQQEAEKFMAEYQLKLQQIEADKQDAAAKLQEQELRYVAETHKTDTDEQIAHADNLVKILTHLREPQSRNDKEGK